MVFSLLSHENELARRAHTTGPNQRTKPNQHRSPNTCHGGLRRSSSVLHIHSAYVITTFAPLPLCMLLAVLLHVLSIMHHRSQHTLLLTLRHPVLCQHLLCSSGGRAGLAMKLIQRRSNAYHRNGARCWTRLPAAPHGATHNHQKGSPLP